jgi:diazepam-binding inhibitor (GABA receptor modulating acyl-CoA-binding protein)
LKPNRIEHEEIAMSDLNARFAAAVADSKTLSERPDNATLLKLYALYKQGSEGDVQGKRPGFTDMVGRAKHDAWAALSGISPEAAKQQYIDLIAELKSA